MPYSTSPPYLGSRGQNGIIHCKPNGIGDQILQGKLGIIEAFVIEIISTNPQISAICIHCHITQCTGSI
jgi:hypothetical protein